MPRDTLLYFIFSVNKLPLYVDDNGFVMEGNGNYQKPDGQPAKLTFSPDGWKDFLVKYARNLKWWGVFRDMAVPMRFVKDGAKILRNRMWGGGGTETVCYLGVMKLNRLTNQYTYEVWYLSEINLTKTNDTFDGFTTEALEGGLIKFLKAYENTKYEIPVADPDAVNVLMDGMEFDFNAIFSVEKDQAITGAGGPYWLGVFLTSQEGKATDVAWKDMFFSPSVVYPNDDWVGKSDRARDIIVSGSIDIFYNKDVTAVVRVDLDDGAGSGILGINQYELIREAGTGGETKTVPIAAVLLPLAAANRIHLKVAGGQGSDFETSFTVLGGNLKFDYVYRYRETVTKGFYLYHLLKRLIFKMTNGLYDVKATNWLFNKKDIVVTSGDALRGLDGAVIKTSLADAFKSIFAYTSIRLSVEAGTNYLVVEPWETTFKNNIIADVGEVRNAELSVAAEDLLFNTINAGYSSQDYTDVNGKYEFNQGQQWTTTITKTIKALDMKSVYRSDPLGIELLRINFEQKLTTDSDSDNDTFFLNVQTVEEEILTDPVTVGYRLNRPPFLSFSGLPHWETSFNVLLSPKNNLLRNGAYLHSLLEKQQDTQAITIASADRNKDIAYTLNGQGFVEADPIQIGNLPARLFLPYYITFETKVPINLLAIMDADSYGKIKFSWNDRDWYGYMMEGGLDPSTQDKQTWKVLSAPENDLLNFQNNA